VLRSLRARRFRYRSRAASTRRRCSRSGSRSLLARHRSCPACAPFPASTTCSCALNLPPPLPLMPLPPPPPRGPPPRLRLEPRPERPCRHSSPAVVGGNCPADPFHCCPDPHQVPKPACAHTCRCTYARRCAGAGVDEGAVEAAASASERAARPLLAPRSAANYYSSYSDLTVGSCRVVGRPLRPRARSGDGPGSASRSGSRGGVGEEKPGTAPRRLSIRAPARSCCGCGQLRAEAPNAQSGLLVGRRAARSGHDPCRQLVAARVGRPAHLG